jgi:ornithine cyclodeaminase/alanine dehydrogenase-like protein (mu-crystallin family)
MDIPALVADKLPYLSGAFLDHLKISSLELVSEIERQIIGERRGEVWCAPKSVVLPGDDRYIMATLGVASEPRVLATKALVTNPRNAERGLPIPQLPDHAARQRDGASAGSGRWQLGDGEAHSGS